MTECLPPPDVSRFGVLDPSHVCVIDPSVVLGRIYSSGGPHGVAWNEFRHYGPTGSRFDHQTMPRRVDPDRGVMYLAPALRDRLDRVTPALKTALAEVYRDRGVVEPGRDAPYFVTFRATRALRLLDLADSDWLSLVGGNAAISSGLRSTAREWARAVYEHYPEVDGVIYSSSHLPAARSIALWERGRNALPQRPTFNEPLTHVGLRPALETFAVETGLDLAF